MNKADETEEGNDRTMAKPPPTEKDVSLGSLASLISLFIQMC